MARTWTLTATLSSLPQTVNGATWVVTNNLSTKMYFSLNEGDTTKNRVDEWDGGTLTDLGFHTWLTANFPSGSAQVLDLAWFNGTLYAAFEDEAVPLGFANVARWDGGTGWTRVLGPLARWPSTGKATHQHLMADSSRIALVYHSIANAKMYASTDGSSWSLQQISAADIHAGYFNLGTNRSRYSSGLLISENQGALGADGGYKIIEPAWTRLSVSGIGQRHLLGYGDGKSFFTDVVTGTEYGIYYSTNWGVDVTYTGFSFLTEFGSTGQLFADTARIYNIADDAILLCERVDDTRAFVWNPDTGGFDEDGACGGAIFGFFKLGSTLYALCEGATSTTARIYSTDLPPATPNARFYFAPAGQSLTEKFTLPFPDVQPGGMTLDRTLGTVVIGSAEPSSEPVVYSTYPYVTGSATYDSFPTGTAIYSLKWI